MTEVEKKESKGDFMVLTGNSNRPLAQEVMHHLGFKLGDGLVDKFSDGEIQVEILENARGRDIFIIQSTCTPHRNLVELLIMADALSRASARSITAVMPYYGYARQDRKNKPGVPISAKLIANLIQASKVTRVMTIDMHSPQIQGFFDIPADNLYASYVLLPYIRDNYADAIKNGQLVIVSPDAGGVERARYYANRLKDDNLKPANIAIIDKRREGPNVSQVMNVIGDVEGFGAIIVDDMIDTAGTTRDAAYTLIKNGAQFVDCLATHAILSGPAIKRINESPIRKVVLTNTINREKPGEKFVFLSVGGLIAEAIKRVYGNEPLRDMFG